VFVDRSWILFTGLVFASYWVWSVWGQTGQWRLPAWVYAVEYAPFLALMAVDGVRRRRGLVAA
jgi:hypothetical protein